MFLTLGTCFGIGSTATSFFLSHECSFHPGIKVSISSSDFIMLFYCLKKKKKINVLDQWHDGSIYWVGQNVHLGFSLRSYRNPNEPCGQPNIWEVPREGDLLHHPASWHDEDLESKSSHDGRSKPMRNKHFLLSTTKASSVTSAKLKVNWEKL